MEDLRETVDISPAGSPHLNHQHHGAGIGEGDYAEAVELAADRNAIGDRLTVALTADQQAVDKATNPNKEPVELMLQSLKRLDSQAHALNPGTKLVLEDLEGVMEGKKSAADMSKKYAGKVKALKAIVADMDLKADKCQDLYQYTCGGFIARHTPNKTTVPYANSRTFSVISARNHALQQEIVTNVPHEARERHPSSHTSVASSRGLLSKNEPFHNES